ncbi:MULTISPECIES: phosphate/phosphite/phosphonate ABC transporter substrate-binding protein [Bacillus]|uniref:Phosphonate ABC transporter substrate-binding protein n=2 Tax=Bacillus TaxID=1386 RepID=A0A0M4GCU0_9BACI|nr:MULTISPECIES: phosphate/phosphite/phosphonate ABC transporter substrate-binding protein [Bacillus]ALC83840.1 phosphonate ABC transporter substrate-binding protein [Bacillus gobiensis]MBP1083124.1 phosphonate transport system substrate-binding protein [Bacillus capparidis]MED1097925.1 phosphate/phosphite/phosphonate ABC transporter substrate-binding protein [Bacillus capparidis]
MKKMIQLLMLLTLVFALSACGTSGANGSGDDTLTIAWYPNESGADMADAREEIGKVFEETTGKKVEHKTTTDYIIAIEALANGSADVAFMGAQGYIEANTKNNKVQSIVVPSGPSGTLDDAKYNSWLAVNNGEQDKYKDGSEFKIDNIADKKFSFVSNSSTSGFKVPSTNIVSYFSKMDKYKDLKAEDLLEGGKFFSEVLFGGSHQGSAVNLLSGKADAAAFCDTCVANYVELADGEENTAGAVYKVKDDAAEPFNTVKGKEFSIISTTPVLNAPFAVNTETVNEEDVKKIKEALVSDEVMNNDKIFVPKDSGKPGLFFKTDKERFVEVEDSWFDPIRELSK